MEQNNVECRLSYHCARICNAAMKCPYNVKSDSNGEKKSEKRRLLCKCKQSVFSRQSALSSGKNFMHDVKRGNVREVLSNDCLCILIHLTLQCAMLVDNANIDDMTARRRKWMINNFRENFITFLYELSNDTHSESVKSFELWCIHLKCC